MKSQVALSDKKFFEVSIGKRILKKQVFYSKGNVPIYSSNVYKPFGFLDDSNESITDFTHDYVLWGIDGNFEFSVKRKGELFAITDHCGAIKILEPSILPEYLAYQLRVKKYEMGFDRTLRASLANIRTIIVDMPTNEHGGFDKEAQLEVTRADALLREIRVSIQSQIDELSKAMIELGDEFHYEVVEATKMFNFPKTNSHVTKRLCRENIGNVPVYGCSQSDESVLGYIKEGVPGIKYYKDALAWNRNGMVGVFFYRQGVFTTNEDQRVIEIKPEYKQQLVPLYLKYILQNEVRKLGYGWSNKLGSTKMVDVRLKIPINDEGEFDTNKQQEIADKYVKVYQTRDDIIQHLQSLARVIVSV